MENEPASPSNEEKNVKKETIPVTWESDEEYTSDENGKYIYTAILPEGYILADGVKLPEIYVIVGGQTYVNTWAPVFNPYANVPNGQSAFDCPPCYVNKGREIVLCELHT